MHDYVVIIFYYYYSIEMVLGSVTLPEEMPGLCITSSSQHCFGVPQWMDPHCIHHKEKGHLRGANFQIITSPTHLNDLTMIGPYKR